MKEKALNFAIIIIFIACLVLFLPIIVMQIPHDQLEWLASEPAISGYGYGGEDDSDDDDGIPPPPPGWVDPGQPRMARDPNTPDIFVWFPAGSVSVPVEVRTYYTGLPPNVPPPPGSVGSLFFFGAWIRGEGTTFNEFNPPIVINAPYSNSGVSQIPNGPIHPFRSLVSFTPSKQGLLTGWPLAMVAHPSMSILFPQETTLGYHNLIPPTQEQQLRLQMYNPATQSWVKLCSSVNIYTKRVSGVLASPIPIDTGANTLLAIAVDETPPLNQVVDDQGVTTLSIEGVNTRLHVLPGTVEPGVHFEITLQPGIPASAPVKLLARPIDIKACHIDHIVNENSTQITQFPKPLGVEFDYDANILANAGGKANVTTALLQNGQWVNMDEFGYQVIREENKIRVDTDGLGTFSMAAR
jgi:hypothetical protein